MTGQSIKATRERIFATLLRRYRVIPMLIEASKKNVSNKGFLKQLLNNIEIAEWTVKDGRADLGTLVKHEDMLTDQLDYLHKLYVESSDMQSNPNIGDIWDELDKIESARDVIVEEYNGVVDKYNQSLELFPGKWMAWLGLKRVVERME